MAEMTALAAIEKRAAVNKLPLLGKTKTPGLRTEGFLFNKDYKY